MVRISGRTLVVDATLAVLIGVAVATATLVGSRLGEPPARVSGTGWLLILAASGALVLRRRHPIAVAVATLVATALYYPTANADGPLALTFVFALYTVALQGLLRQAVVLGLVATVAMAGSVAAPAPGAANTSLDGLSVFLLAGWVVAAVAIGGFQHEHHDYRLEVAERMRAAALRQEEKARRHDAEERLRTAREVHDAVGHQISLIRVQATACLHALHSDRRSGQASDPAQALEAIKDASGQALRELRSTLGLLRQVDGETLRTTGLGQLRALVQQTRGTGLDVGSDTSGTPRPLPGDVDLAAYRIIQEALTNVTRHSTASRVDIEVAYTSTALELTIRDNGQGSGCPPGNGLRGMSERANLLGGDLTAGATPDGYLVQASLPLVTR